MNNKIIPIASLYLAHILSLINTAPAWAKQPCFSQPSSKICYQENVPPTEGLKQSLNCSIQGQIYGIDPQQARYFSVVIFDPNTDEALGKVEARSTERLPQPHYSISLKRYDPFLLRVFQKESNKIFPVRTNPSPRLVDCFLDNQIHNADFALL